MFVQLKNILRRGSSKQQSTMQPNGKRHSKQHESMEDLPTPHNEHGLPCYSGLERYELTSKLGDGAFSNVYKAFDLDTKRKVAVKAVRKLELSQSQRASVLKEVQLMRTIDHPSIIKLYGFIETKEHYFLILELCEGGELFHRIVRLTYFSEELSRHCIRQVADGIRYLHEEKGIVHRDIKPENLLFEPIQFMERVSPMPPQQPEDEDDEPKEDEGEFVPGLGGGGIGRIKIADFGLSKVVWDQQTMTPCGTVGYTAPEIVRDERYSKSVDMWALGCVLYTLLCGFPPFYDDNIQVLTEKVAHGQYTFLSPWWDTISDSAKDLISHLLCIDPDERYTIDQFFSHPWMHQEQHQQYPSELPKQHEDDMEQTPDTSTTATADTDDEIKTDAPTSSKRSSLIVPSAPRNIPNATNTTENGAARRHDIFAPSINTLKEMFDVSYAVQRIAEEKSRRKNNYTFANAFGHPLNMDNGEDADQALINQRLRNSRHQDNDTDALSQQMQDSLTLIPPTTTTSPVNNDNATPTTPLFELSMNNATLLGRRRNTSTTTTTTTTAAATDPQSAGSGIHQ
ncbi:Pkinase-domain-containing protein [Lichtheimia hyalospora FSU 10163]|nr:Pkinase-domain-containing protein [Lichtheimia hyalospora FSU 10163]